MQKNKILIVDDEQMIRFAIGRFLTSKGYEVNEAADCAGAEDACRANRPDLAIVDYRMPDGNAIDPVPYQPREITNFVSMQDTLHMDALAPEDYKKLPKDLDKEQVGPRDKDLGQKEAKMVTKQLEHVMDLLEASKTENGRRGIGSC